MSNSETTPATKKQKIDDNADDAVTKTSVSCVEIEKELQSKLWKIGGLKEVEELNIVLRHEGKQIDTPIKLGYFPLRALAFLPQVMLEVSGISYEYHLLAGSSFQNLKGSLTFGRMPILFDWFGKGNHLAQSGAIIRTLSLKTKLAGVNNSEQSMCDMLYEQLQEAFRNDSYSVSSILEGVKSGADLTQVPQWKKMARINDHSMFQRSVSALKCFETLLEKSSSIFLVGAQLTYVDLALWCRLLSLSQTDNVPDWADKLKLPHLNELYLHIMQLPNIKTFLDSGRLLPRFGKDYKYKPGMFCKSPEV